MNEGIPDDVIRAAEDQVVLGWVTGLLLRSDGGKYEPMVRVAEVVDHTATIVETTGVLARPGIRYRVHFERIEA